MLKYCLLFLKKGIHSIQNNIFWCTTCKYKHACICQKELFILNAYNPVSYTDVGELEWYLRSYKWRKFLKHVFCLLCWRDRNICNDLAEILSNSMSKLNFNTAAIVVGNQVCFYNGIICKIWCFFSGWVLIFDIWIILKMYFLFIKIEY